MASIDPIIPTLRGRYYKFAPNKYGCAVVARIGAEGAWTAYIGGCSPESEEEGLAFVVAHGAKLSEADARHFFPELAKVPYRD